MSINDLELILGVLLPLFAGFYIFLFGWVFGRQHWLYRLVIFSAGLGGLVCQLLLAFGFATGLRTPFVKLFRWSPLPSFEVNVAFRADFLSFLFALPVSVLSFLFIFYLLVRHPEPENLTKIKRGRLFGLVLFAQGVSLAAFYSTDLVLFYVWLEVLGVIFYLLGGPVLRGVSSPKISYQGYGVSVAGGFMILAPLLVIISRNGGASDYNQLAGATVDNLLFAFISLGLLLKLAQFPFQVIWGSLKEVPGLIQAVFGVIGLLPLAVYLLIRLQIIVGDRLDLFQGSNGLFLLVGCLTVFFCGWGALTEKDLIARNSYLVGGSTGFVVIALGLSDLQAALGQLPGLVLGAVLLFLSADLLQIEFAHAPPDPKNAARSIPIKRPLSFRALLVLCYFVGICCQLGLPLTPIYFARWMTLSGLLAGGFRAPFALALTGSALMALGAAQSLPLLLPEVRHTLESLKNASRLPLIVPALLTLTSIGLSFAPSLIPKGINELNPHLGKTVGETLPSLLSGPGSLAGFLFLGSGLAILAVTWRFSRAKTAPAFNGGMLFGAEAEAEHKALLNHSRALAVVEEEEESFGFEDEFFEVGLKHNLAPPLPKVEPRLKAGNYFGPLIESLGLVSKLIDTTNAGNLFSRIGLSLLRRLNGVLEWLTERFYPALAAFLVLIFIFLLTR